MNDGYLKRIVETDNFGGDYPDEKFLLFPMDEPTCRTIADAVNNYVGEHNSRYWKVVDYDYVLQPGFEP